MIKDLVKFAYKIKATYLVERYWKLKRNVSLLQRITVC